MENTPLPPLLTEPEQAKTQRVKQLSAVKFSVVTGSGATLSIFSFWQSYYFNYGFGFGQKDSIIITIFYILFAMVSGFVFWKLLIERKNDLNLIHGQVVAGISVLVFFPAFYFATMLAVNSSQLVFLVQNFGLYNSLETLWETYKRMYGWLVLVTVLPATWVIQKRLQRVKRRR